MININSEDFGLLCFCALRHCHGRKTYMPSVIQKIVSEHFDDLDESILTAIEQDEYFQETMDLWGDDYDKEDWRKFYRALSEFLLNIREV